MQKREEQKGSFFRGYVLYATSLWLAVSGCVESKSADSKDTETVSGADGGDAATDSDPLKSFGELRKAAAAAGKLLGVAVDAELLSEDETYVEILTAEFDYVTPEDATKWESLERQRGNRTFDNADAIIDFAESHGQAIKGHTFVWHKQSPIWVKSSLGADDLREAIKDNIETTMTRYKGRVRAWDVVNEAVDTSTTSGYTESVFYKTLGPEYIADAFRWARKADPDALLFYNEVGIERLGAKSDFTYELMKSLLEDDVPIDGIGFQAHNSIHRYPSLSDLRENIRRFADLGLIVNISELDARTLFMPGTTEERWAAQRIAFQQVVGACVAEPGCEGVTLWGFQDGHSWINDEGPAEDALIYDRSYEKKPAYYGVLDGLEGKLPVAGENQVENGDFSDGTEGWDAAGATLTAAGAVDRDGRAACVTDRSESYQGLVQEGLTDRLEDGGPFAFSALVRLTGNDTPETVSAGLIVQEEGADPETRNIASRPIEAGKWMALDGYFGLGFDNTPVSIGLEISGPSSEVELCLTDIAIRPLSHD